jgi:translation initiation factor IF-3
MRPKISDNDYGTKSGHVRRFLDEGSKVRASIMFRGREMAHTELGLKLLHRLAEDMAGIATVEAEPKVDGRNMVMVLAPSKSRARVVPIRDTEDDTGPDLAEFDGSEVDEFEEGTLDVSEESIPDADEEQVEA